MSDNALWILDLLQIQIQILQRDLLNKRVKRELFDKYSYRSWALTETMLVIDDYSGYVNTSVIQEVLTMQLDDYLRYYNTNPKMQIKYLYASQVIESLLKIAGGYVND